jgi:hypothetical protein
VNRRDGRRQKTAAASVRYPAVYIITSGRCDRVEEGFTLGTCKLAA